MRRVYILLDNFPNNTKNLRGERTVIVVSSDDSISVPFGTRLRVDEYLP